MNNPFGMAEPKREGGKLWPNDYLCFNGRLPKKSFYSAEELEEQKQKGYTDAYYSMDRNSKRD